MKYHKLFYDKILKVSLHKTIFKINDMFFPLDFEIMHSKKSF